MSADRELLEAAARAAGIYWQDWTETRYLGADGQLEPGLREWPYDWNPLTDDGDALRLAVRLGIDIQLFAVGGTARRPGDPFVRANVDRLGRSFAQQIVDDPAAATRRAITRAAAAIGATTAQQDPKAAQGE